MVFFFTLQGWFHGRTGVGVDGEERVEIDIRAGWLSDVKFSPNVPQIIFFSLFTRIKGRRLTPNCFVKGQGLLGILVLNVSLFISKTVKFLSLFLRRKSETLLFREN